MNTTLSPFDKKRLASQPKRFSWRSDVTIPDFGLTNKDEEDGTRYYTDSDGNQYPSVTTVLGHKDKEFFAEWRKNNPGEAEKATERGARIHALVEDILSNKPIPEEVSSKDSFMLDKMRPVLNGISKIVCLEQKMCSKILGVAGTIDCLADYDGLLSVIDFKTGKYVKQASDFPDYFLQAMAYGYMVYEHLNLCVADLIIIRVTDDGQCIPYHHKPTEELAKELKDRIDTFKKEVYNG